MLLVVYKDENSQAEQSAVLLEILRGNCHLVRHLSEPRHRCRFGTQTLMTSKKAIVASLGF